MSIFGNNFTASQIWLTQQEPHYARRCARVAFFLGGGGGGGMITAMTEIAKFSGGGGGGVDQGTCPLRLSIPFDVGARVLTLKFLEHDT